MHKNKHSSTITITLDAHQNIEHPKLDVCLILDDQVFEIDTAKTVHKFMFEYDATKISQHRLELKVSGKQQHLQKFYVDSANNIPTLDVPKLAFIIDKFEFDGHDISQILMNTARYHHTTNGQTGPMHEEYTEWLGYDGSIVTNFLTPVFSWFIVDYKF
jgi:hypothetical protein